MRMVPPILGMDSQRDDRFASLSGSGWLSLQPETFCRAMICSGRVVALGVRQPVTMEGDEDPRIFGVVRGAIGTYSSHRHEFPVLGTVLFPGQWFGLGPRLIGGERTLTFVAMEDSELLCFGPAEFQKIGEIAPDLNDRLAQLAQFMSNYSAQIIAELLIPETDRRIVAVLLRLCERSYGNFSFRLSQAEIGEMSNASRDTVNKLVKRLAQNGLLTVRYGRIEVADYAGLARWFDQAAK
jgi:CRP/FNR family transcriptional regulator, cyclic AMP receptor protein